MEKVRIAKIVNTHGLNGELKIYLTTSNPEMRFAKNSIVYIGENPNSILLTAKVLNYKYKSNSIAFVTLSGYEDINKVEQYVNTNMYADKLELEDGSYYIDDLIGFKIVDSNQREYGIAEKAVYVSDKIYFVVGKDYLPFDTEHFIDKVDLEKKELILSELGAGIFEWL